MSDTKFHIREATPDDAEAIIGHVHRIASEPGIRIPMGPGEFKVTVEEERRILAEYASSENSLYLLAESDSEVVGVLNCNGWKRRAMWHVATLGMTVRQEWRGRGVGTALLQRAVKWAKASRVVTRLELQVYASNAPAIRLYERFGFEVEGRLRRAAVYEGQHEDCLVMSLLL
jgi:RimJ/RimL family protein N-acetyltransferase